MSGKENLMIKLLHGDCLDLMKDIPAKSIGAIITDPPYGTTACKWDSVIPFEPMWKQSHRVIKDNGAIILFGSEPFSSALRMSNIKRFKYDWYWKKDRASNHLNAKRQPMRNIETISIFNCKTYFPIMEFWGKPSNSVGKAKNKLFKAKTTGNFMTTGGNLKENIKYPRQLLSYNMPHPRIHPTQKPVELMEYLIKTYTLENETVLDFTMGSGSTGVACVNLNRKFIGIEKDKEYFEIASQRIKETQSNVTK